MLEPRIQQQFFENADVLNQSAEVLARPVAVAAQALATCLTSGGKLWVSGSGVGACLAPVLVQALCGRFERERPPLAAVGLSEGPAVSLAQQLAALAQPGDLLVLLDGEDAPPGLQQAVRAAHEAELSVLVVAGESARAWQGVLRDTDVAIIVPHARAARVAELQLLVLNVLCDAVDLQLLGEEEST